MPKWRSWLTAVRLVPATFIFVTALLLLGSAPAAVPVNTGGWPLFRDTLTGLTFRYPPSLRIRLRNPQDFGLLDAALIVDLVGDTAMNPETTVLRFIVDRGNPTAETTALKVRGFRSACRSLTTMTIDDHRAFVCVSCGRAACQWSVNILKPRRCTILTLLGGADSDWATPPPRDGIFPLLTIIKTLHFETPSRP
jgi:hypothetical protein